MPALTNAERQARHRARNATLGLESQELQRAILAALVDLGRKVDNLAQAVDKLTKTSRNGPERDVTGRGRPRARVGDGASPPTGGGRPPSSNGVPADLEGRVLEAMTGHGANSAGAIRDALTAQDVLVSAPVLAEVLVHLQDAHRVIREPGEGARPDRWRAVDGAMEALAQVTAPAVRVSPAPETSVLCSDYRAHAASHAWDPDLGRFRCSECQPFVLVNPGEEVRTHAPSP